MSPLRAEYEAEQGRVTDSAYIAFLETLTEPSVEIQGDSRTER